MWSDCGKVLDFHDRHRKKYSWSQVEGQFLQIVQMYPENAASEDVMFICSIYCMLFQYDTRNQLNIGTYL